MTDADDRRHAVPGIRTGKVLILLLQDAQLSGIGIDQLGKTVLEAGNMRTAFTVENIVAEAEDILLKRFVELNADIRFDAFGASGEFDDLADRLLAFVQLLHIAGQPLGLTEYQFFLFAFPFVLIINRQLRIQIGDLMEPVLNGRNLKCVLSEDLRIRLEGHPCAGVLRLPDDRQQTVRQLDRRNAPLVSVMKDPAAGMHLHVQELGQRIDDRGTDAVQTAGDLVCILIEFSAGMQRGIDDTLRRHAHLMHVNRDASAVIPDFGRAVLMKDHRYIFAVAGQMLVHRVVSHFIQQMIHALIADAADVHAGPAADRLQAFQHRDRICIITVISHILYFSFLLNHQI